MTQLKPHNHYSFSEIQEALASIGKREYCERFMMNNDVMTFHLDDVTKNDCYPNDGDPDYQECPFQWEVEELIAALRSFGITEDEILVVSFD